MAVFKVETKNQVDVDKKTRVYFTCHPEDFERYFQKICEDIFKTHDCAVYYTEDMTALIAEDEKVTDLGRYNLFVIPVTFKLLTTPNRAMDEDVAYALKEHIPILPIVMEPGIDEFYSKPDKFGELQYLSPYSTDLTEISYEEKLKKYLESVLISDELAKRVRAAFDAYIFLSYRKKDRKYANELMRLIHKNPECRDMAIWFDEFLTPGESFKKSIEEALDHCKLFTLLVTPRILERVVDANGEERDNYVVSTELPLARKKKAEKGVEILPVEMEETDKEKLSAVCEEACVEAEEAKLRERLLQAICHMAITTSDTPEHNFLIGLAYLNGIDMEINKPRALEMITFAAEQGLPEAMQKLYEMYDGGIGVTLDYKKAALWAEKYYKHITRRYGYLLPAGLTAMHQLIQAYVAAGEYRKAFRLKRKLYICQRMIGGRKSRKTLMAKGVLASRYSDLGNYKKALKIYEEVYAVNCEKYGERDPKSFLALNDVAYTYNLMGLYEKAVELQKKVALLAYDILGEESPDTESAIGNLAVYLSNIGDYDLAFDYAFVLRDLCVKLYGEEHPKSISALNTLAGAYADINEPEKARELQEQAYMDSCKVLGEEHPYTITILSNVAHCDYDLKEYEEAKCKLEKVYNLRCAVFGEKHPDTLKASSDIAAMLFYLGRYDESIALGEEAYALLCKVCGRENPQAIIALRNVAKAYVMVGDLETACKYCKEVYLQYKKLHGVKHPTTQEAEKELSYLRSIMK